ncbi:MAG: NRDE family protein [Pseudomonadales bacterium]|nr:NRDE family protein [Pseudomonadales bacterium]
MCLLAWAWQMDEHWPLVLLGNRDERHNRLTRPLHRWEGSSLVAGQDMEAGGTWLGIAGAGRLAALTNVREPGRLAGKYSRGHLVMDFLTSSLSLDDYAHGVQGREQDYGGFNLVLREGDQMVVISNRGRSYQVLKPGFYVLSNAALDTPWPKSLRLKELLQLHMAHVETDWLPWLSDTSQAPDELLPDTGVGLEWERFLSASLIVSPGYGTRCSSLVRQGHKNQWEFREQTWTADGHPQDACRVERAWSV